MLRKKVFPSVVGFRIQHEEELAGETVVETDVGAVADVGVAAGVGVAADAEVEADVEVEDNVKVHDCRGGC